MKLRTIITGLFVAMITVNSFAQNAVAHTSPDGYISRGIQMFNIGNYNGAIDQLSFAKTSQISATQAELIDFYIAESYFRKGDVRNALYTLRYFLDTYPTSFKAPLAQVLIGDVYFYHARYAGAVPYYTQVNLKALTKTEKEDMTYRLAYSYLRLKEGDKINDKEINEEDVEEYRKQASTLFQELSGTPRYRDAATFYQAYLKYEKNDFDYALDDFITIASDTELGYNAKYYMTQIYYVKEDLDNTISTGLELLNDNKTDDRKSELNRLVGESYYRQNDTENTVKYINQYLESTDEPTLSAQYILGVLNYRKGEFAKATKLLEKVAPLDNVMGQSAYYYLGQCYRKQENLPLATMAFEKAAKQEFSKETQEAAFYNYAVIQNEGGRTPFNKAIEMFEEFLTKFPNSKYADEVREYMITLFVTGNDYSKALASISRIKNPNNKVLGAKQVVLYNLGTEALSNGKISMAQDYFSQARTLGNYDKNLDIQNSLWLGECAYRKGDYAQAAKFQNEYLNNCDSRDANYALGYYNLGYTLFQQRNYTDARKAFQKSLSSTGINNTLKNDIYNRIGDTYYYGEDFKTAEKFYDKSSGDYSIYQKAMMLGLAKKHKEKIAKLQELIDKYPTSSLIPMAMLEQADSYVSMNKNKQAIAIYNELIKRFPENAYARKALLNKAITERNAKNEASAIEAYKAVISKYPTSEEAIIALEDLKLIYADKGELPKLSKFIASIQNAPKLEVSDMDRLTFEAAEKDYMEDNNNINKMKNYLASTPNGAYAANAKYYVAKYNFNNNKGSEALTLINEIETSNADASFMEDALAMKAAILSSQGKIKESLNTYKTLAAKASNADNRLTAQLGILRSAVKLKDYPLVIESANILLKESGLTAEEENEVTFARAYAYNVTGKTSLAASDFKKLSKDVRNVYGAESAVSLANIQYNNGNLKDAENILNELIDAGTPHEYWLARGFILLADIYYKQGNTFEACEYLESLKSNYPGYEKDIFKMIDDRLNSWKKTSKGTN